MSLSDLLLDPNFSKIVAAFAVIVSAIVGLSGWVTFLYNHFSSKPKNTGKILGIMEGDGT